MKKIWKIWVFAVFVVFAAGNLKELAYGDIEDFEYECWEGDKAAYITGYNGTEENLIIPEEINGCKVYGVELKSYKYDEETGDRVEVAHNTTVKTLTLPSGVDELNVANLYALTDIYVNENNEIYESEDGLLYDKETNALFLVPPGRQGGINVKEGTKAIGTEWYHDDFLFPKVTEINIPSSVEEIFPDFIKCGSAVESIKVAEDNAVYSSEEGVLYDKEKKSLLSYPCGRSGEVNIPDSVTEISTRAFMSCHSITGIRFNEGLQKISMGAFAKCPLLEEIILPDSVTEIGESVFAYCTKISEVKLPEGLGAVSGTLFYGCTSLETIRIPASVKSFSPFALASSSIKKVIIDEENTELSSSGDMICNKKGDKLIAYLPVQTDTLTVPDTITTIGSEVFNIDTNVKEIILPEGVKTIEDRAFYHCSSLESVVLPEGLETIGAMAFCYCMELKSITIPKTVSSIGVAIFSDCSSLESVILPEGIESIPMQAFSNCEVLKSIEIPKTVTSIGDYAFMECWKLQSLTIPENVTSIGEWAIFASGIQDLYIESVQISDIGNYAFGNINTYNIYVYDENLYNRMLSEYSDCTKPVLLKRSDPLELDKEAVTLYTGNKKKTATVKATLNDVTGTVKWKTSNKAVATVKNGKITAVKKGTAVITASVGNYKKKVRVTVKNPVITVVNGSESINTIKVKKGKTVYYRVSVNPSNSGIKLKISNKAKKYATVKFKNNTLSVKGLKKGTVSFKLQSGKAEKNVKINIR